MRTRGKRAAAAVFLGAILFAAGCGQKDEAEAGVKLQQETEEKDAELRQETEEKDAELQQETEEADAKASGWKAAYLAYLEELGEDKEAFTYSLIYVDEDEVPELVIDSGFEAGGCRILTYQKEELAVLKTQRLGFTYLEKENLLCNSDGNMGVYYDYVSSISDGSWIRLATGEYGDGEEGVQVDENNDFIYEYSWEGEEVTEQEYRERLAAVFDAERAVSPEDYYIYSEMRSLLETGQTVSAGHSYEFVTADVSWSEAKSLCEEKGGYLATITAKEELEQIEALLREEGTAGTAFWVGASNQGEESFGFRWLEPGKPEAYDMLGHFSALWQGFWQEEQPNYRGIDENGRETEEGCVYLQYQEEEEGAFLFDAPDDILTTFPSFAGKIGYICEYDGEEPAEAPAK